MKPALSVVMPTYNGEQFIASALASLPAGQGDEFELVIVDDGSFDRTLDIVRAFAKRLPIKLISSPRTGNWVAASNLGLREATNDWVCFLHQDDVWLPGRLDHIGTQMQHAKGPLILYDSCFIGPSGERLGKWTCPLHPGDVSPEEFTERLLIQNFIAMPCPVFLRRPALESGGLDEDLWFSADWDFWLRLGAMGTARYAPRILTGFRIHAGSQTMARKVFAGEWEQQLTIVYQRHVGKLRGSPSHRSFIQDIAAASIAVNSLLAALSRGESLRAWPVVSRLIRLGPRGWGKYLRDSRIVQRVASRFRLQCRCIFPGWLRLPLEAK